MKCFLYAFSLVVILPPTLFAAQIQGKVIRVLDGDTVDVLQERQPVRVRLLNIDAPEKKQPFGRWSTNQLKALLAGQSVTVSYTQTDRYGRVLGRVVTANGTEANRQQVLKGAAWVYDRYNTDNSLPALQRQAQTQKRGLWADKAPTPPWEWRHSHK
ncbi:TPA: thermonuclease family protein [Escherichia coli]|nr:thermonuclease family protein [Escherichia coli]